MLRPESLLASLGESHPHGRRRLDPRSFHWRGRPTPVSDLLRARTGSSRDRTRTGWYTTVTGCNPHSEYYGGLRLLPVRPPPSGPALGEAYAFAAPGGLPCSVRAHFRHAALSDPAGVSGDLAVMVAYCCLPGVESPSASGSRAYEAESLRPCRLRPGRRAAYA